MEPTQQGSSSNTNPNQTPPAPSSPPPTPPVQPPTPAPSSSPDPAPVTPQVSQPAQPAVPTPPPKQPTPPLVQPAQPQAVPPLQPKKSPLAMIAAIIGGLLVLGLGIFLVMNMLSSVKLEPYSNEDFSLRVPAGYEREVKDAGVTFSEKDTEENSSKVFAYYDEYPSKITEAQRVAAKNLFKTQLEKLASDLSSSDASLENVKVAEVQYKGADALQLTATAEKNGKEVGKIKLVAVLTLSEVYMVGVASHTSDASLAAKTDEIINSFTLK